MLELWSDKGLRANYSNEDYGEEKHWDWEPCLQIPSPKI